jgi:hypothetical protein
MKGNFLQVGDVFEVGQGFKFYFNLGQLSNIGAEITVEKFNFAEAFGLTGEYIVTDVRMDGGSSGGGMSGHDDYPDGWHVTAKKLGSMSVGERKYNPEGFEISFYQSGCFSCMMPNVEVQRKMQKVEYFK